MTILGFEGHVISVKATQIYHCMSMNMSGYVPMKPYLQNGNQKEAGFGFGQPGWYIMHLSHS